MSDTSVEHVSPQDLQTFLEGAFRIPEEDEGREVFQIDDDSKANWAVRIVLRHHAEAERIKDQAENEIARIRDWQHIATSTVLREAEFLEGALERYFRTLRDNGYEKSIYKLPAGTLKRNAGRAAIEITDEEALLEWAKANVPEIVESRVTKSGLAKATAIHENKLLLDDEIVPGASVRPPVETYKVVASNEEAGRS